NVIWLDRTANSYSGLQYGNGVEDHFAFGIFPCYDYLLMTYCLGVVTKYGLIMASDSRTNAGSDQVTVVKKMHTLVHPGERVFVLLCSGSLSCSQSILTLLKRDFDAGHGLATAPTMYDAARIVGQQVRKVSALDRDYLERDDYRFNVNFILGGQIRGEAP